MIPIKVENIVASGTFGGPLELEQLVVVLDGAEYEPERFPGLVCRLKDPRCAFLIFGNGKVVCTGAKSVEDVERASGVIAKILNETGLAVTEHPEMTVQNIVGVANVGRALDLVTISLGLGLERIEYEPEQFPGLIYRSEEPKVVMLFFASGKVVCTGAKTIKDSQLALNAAIEELKASDLF